MKKVLHIGWCILEVFIIAYVIVLTSFILHRNLYGFTQFGNYTFVNITVFDIRNIDNVKKNNLLVIKSDNTIKENDLVYYYYVQNDKYIVRSNKVVAKLEGSSDISYQVDDKESSLIPGKRIIGTTASKIGFFGGLLALLESRYGFIFLVLLPIVIVFAYQLYDFIITIRSERESVADLNKKEYYEVPVIDKIIETDVNSFLDKDDDIEIL